MSLTAGRHWPAQGVKLTGLSKKCIFRAENGIFLKSSFYTKWSVTQNTIFHWVKNIWLLPHSKLVFFTRFNLDITQKWFISSKGWELQYCVVSTVCSCCFEAVHYTQTIRWAQTCWICINLKIVAHNITTVVDWAPQYLSSHGELEVLKTV